MTLTVTLKKMKIVNVQTLIAALAIMSPLSVPAQDDAQQTSSDPSVLPSGSITIPDADEGVEIDSRVYLELQGGGELTGILTKRTPSAVFIDIGPEIVRIEKSQLRNLSTLALARDQLADNPGFIETFFGEDFEESARMLPALSRPGTAEEILSQTDVIDDAKGSVVLIANPGGSGSGFLLDDRGRVITNHHVIGGEKYHNVTIFQRNEENQWEKHLFQQVEVEAYSWLYDIAILRLDLDDLKEEDVEIRTLPLAGESQLSVGDQVYAIGNPGGLRQRLEHTVSEGIVSSLTRNVNDILYIQTTAAVNPGNSGGPIVNTRGEVVGLVTLKSSFQEGIGFALPVSLMQHFIDHSEAFAYGDQAPNQGIRYLTPP